MLNKITGCESRTVPPLYVLMAKITGESRSLGKPGKADLHRGSSPPQSISQKTYALDSPISRVITDDVLVAEKRLRRLKRTPQPICFQEELV